MLRKDKEQVVAELAERLRASETLIVAELEEEPATTAA